MRTTLGGNVYNEGSFFDLRGGLNNRLSTELIQRDELSRVFNYIPNLTSEAVLVKRQGVVKVSSDRALPITSVFDGTSNRWATDTAAIFDIESNTSFTTIPFDGTSVGLTGFPSWAKFKAQNLDIIATGTQLLKWNGAEFDYLWESDPVEILSYTDGAAWVGTYGRPTTAYKKNSSLALVSVAIDELRSGHHLTATDVGTLLEPAGTQLHTFTEALDNAAWAKATGVTIDANSADEPVASPAGLMDGIVENDGVSQSHHVDQAITITANADVAAACFALSGTRGFAGIAIFETATAGNNIRGNFNLSTGEFTTAEAGTGSGVRAYAERMIDGRWRCYLAGNIGNGATALKVRYRPQGSLTLTSYEGVAGSPSTPAIYLWGMHAQQVGWPSSYIPRLDATAASRSADTMYYDFSPARAFEATTLLADCVEIGGRYKESGRIYAVGQQGSNDLPRITLFHTTTQYRANWVNPAVEGSNGDRAHENVGSRLSLRAILHPEGAMQHGLSVNGGAETLSAKGTARGIDGTYNRLQIAADTAGTNGGLVLLKSFKWETIPAKVTFNPKYIVSYNNMMVGAGHDRGKVRFSAINNVARWPVENERDIGDNVIGLGVYNDLLLVFTDKRLYHMRGFSPLAIQIPYTVTTDCTSHRSIITSEHGVFWWGTQGMMWSPDAFHPFILSDLKIPLTIAGLNSLLYEKVHGIYNPLEQRIEYYLVSIGQTVEDIALYYYPRVGVKPIEGVNVGGFWPQTGMGVSMSAGGVVTVSGRKRVYLGSPGYIYHQTGSLDDGAAISAVLETKTDTTEFGPMAVKRLRQLVPRLFMDAAGLVQYAIILDHRTSPYKVWTLQVVGGEGFIVNVSSLNIDSISVPGVSKDFRIGASERFTRIKHRISDSVAGPSGIVGIINTGYLVNI